jgi:8-oxo-dGTP pyrophosphatase MutT (NUDIX family)/transcriptional regulator with XRE-family HTH domain
MSTVCRALRFDVKPGTLAIMARRAIEIGAVGRRVAENLERLRELRHLNFTELSGLLKRLGRPLSAETIGKVERRERRIDVDDLVALAVALDTTPNRLLLPSDASDNKPIELTPEVTVSALNAWKWATGEEPLPAGTAPPDHQILVRDDRERLFTRENRPHNVPEPFFRNVGHDMSDYPELAGMIAHIVMEAHERGVSHGSVVRLFERMDMYRRFGNLDDVLSRLSSAADDAHLADRPIPVEEALEQPVAAAIVTSELGVLIGRRNDGKPPWTFIAGEVEPGESPADAAVREVKEETGLRVRAGDVIGERVHPKTGRTMIYMAATPTHGTDVFVGDEVELAEVRWVSLAEADDLLPGMFEPVREYLAGELGLGAR